MEEEKRNRLQGKSKLLQLGTQLWGDTRALLLMKKVKTDEWEEGEDVMRRPESTDMFAPGIGVASV